MTEFITKLEANNRITAQVQRRRVVKNSLTRLLKTVYRVDDINSFTDSKRYKETGNNMRRLHVLLGLDNNNYSGADILSRFRRKGTKLFETLSKKYTSDANPQRTPTKTSMWDKIIPQWRDEMLAWTAEQPVITPAEQEFRDSNYEIIESSGNLAFAEEIVNQLNQDSSPDFRLKNVIYTDVNSVSLHIGVDRIITIDLLDQ